jgi:hypothetical protein
MRCRAYLLIVPFMLAACSESQEMRGRETTQEMAVFDATPSEEPPNGQAPATGPQIAYTYAMTYTLADPAIAPAQARAVALCTRLGRTRCIVIKTNLTRNDESVDGSVNLLVAAPLAARFERDLAAIAAGAGGETSARTIEAEDLTKQLIDTAARIRAKQALADRLLALIRTANGKVADLVAAEQAYADVQEQLDGARTLDAELRRRVAMSAVNLTYRSTRATGTWAPLSRATGEVTQTLATSVAALVTFVVAAIPWVALLALVIWFTRRIGWRPRWPFRRRETRGPMA